MTTHPQLPKHRPGRSILQDWVSNMPLRHQGVLIAAVRGCDGASKNCNAKPLVRYLRGCFLNAADNRELDQGNSFMALNLKQEEVSAFYKDWDQYPMHFVQHLMHAFQVVAYHHPSHTARRMAELVYLSAVRKLHLKPESQYEMDERLGEDRIAAYGTHDPDPTLQG